MDSANGLGPELESFRQQWLSEVRTKHGESAPGRRHEQSGTSSRASGPALTTAATSRWPKAQPPSPTRTRRQAAGSDEDHAERPTRSFDGDSTTLVRSLDGLAISREPGKELVSALDHYEEAMEKEAEGNMGESLKLYRKAYRLDHGVDRRYREKHFPQGFQASKPATAAAQPKTSRLAPSSNETAPPQQVAEPARLPTHELIASFVNCQIEPAPSEIEGDPPPLCLITSLPSELLVHVMRDVAAADVADFARLSLVCKALAYVVAMEDQIWRAVSLGDRFGFTGMHHDWNKALDWSDLWYTEDHPEDGKPVTSGADRVRQSIATTKSLIPRPFSSWKHMFRSRPRIRFNGCYISTVNYVRTGQASTNQATWGGAPIHIVTYYRYLRFFRDGTAISLLTTTEPSDVVHYLTRDLFLLHRDQTLAHLPSAVVLKAYKARWRLSAVGEKRAERDGEAGQEGDLTVESESHDPKYMFRMDLSLRTAGKGAQNNKVVWRSHFSYNRMTDDWAEFTLKHDKAFIFSRVGSYGHGE